jgi:hypothetical protein
MSLLIHEQTPYNQSHNGTPESRHLAHTHQDIETLPLLCTKYGKPR